MAEGVVGMRRVPESRNPESHNHHLSTRFCSWVIGHVIEGGALALQNLAASKVVLSARFSWAFPLGSAVPAVWSNHLHNLLESPNAAVLAVGACETREV